MKWLQNRSEKSRQMIIIVVTTLGVYLGFRFILPLIFPFIVAYFIAWLLRPLTEFLYRRIRMSRMIGGTLSLLLFVAVTGAGIFYLVNSLLRQIFHFMKNMPVYRNLISAKLEEICNYCDHYMGFDCGTFRKFTDDYMRQTMDHIKSDVMPNLTQKTITITIYLIGAIGVILIVLIAALLIVKDMQNFKDRFEHSDIYRDIHKVTKKLADAGIAYLRSQVIIMMIVAVICVLGLTLLKNEYPLLIGIGIAFMDALPILGSGLIFIPWSIIMLLGGDIYTAAILITIFFVCQIVREVLEPKLIGNRIGIKPLFTLIAMYIGVRLFSIAGFFLGPIGLVIIITIVKVVREKMGDEVDPEQTPIPGVEKG